MNLKKTSLAVMLIISLLASIFILPASSVAPASAAGLPLIDDFEDGLWSSVDNNGTPIGYITFNDPNSSVGISTTSAPPTPVPGLGEPNTVLQMDLNVKAFAGFVHNFSNEERTAWIPQDWSAYEGISFWLYGNNSGTTMFVDVLDNRAPDSTRDDAERWSIDMLDNFSGWKEIKIPFESMRRKEIGNGAPNDGFGLTEVHGWALGTVTTPGPQTYFVDHVMLYGVAPIRPLTVSFTTIDYKVTEGSTAAITVKLSKPSDEPVTVQYATTYGQAVAHRDYVPTSGTLTFAPNVTQQVFTVQTIDDAKYQGERGVLLRLSNPTGGAVLGLPPVARLAIQDNEGYDASLLDDFETFPYLWSTNGNRVLNNPEIAAGSPLALPGQGALERVLEVSKPGTSAASLFQRVFPIGQDWSGATDLTFWYYGQNSKRDVTVRLTNNQATPSNPKNWKLVWSDEFNGRAGTAPNSNIWGQEVGDGTVNGIPGWGNSELQYYTAGTENVAMNGRGNLVITTKADDGSRLCYYGPCEYTSARLLTSKRFEIAYGRVEARVKVPTGAGLWPAFWMLGTNIDQVGWPQSGEIDIMEHVGRIPNEVFGTIHGPGYSGGQSYGQVYDLGRPVADNFHVFAVEWQPDKITWFIDGIAYFTATPNDPFMQGKEWVFNQPFYLLLNVAVGGNFGGAVGPDTTFPQTTLVDYVRVYQAPPQLVTYSNKFRDDFTGWKTISLPLDSFRNQSGTLLDLSSVQSIGFHIPGGMNKPVRLDQIRLVCEATVTSIADDGPGSLRQALSGVCAGGTIRFDPSLAGKTITLTSGPYVLRKNVTIDGSNAPGIKISGNGADRVLIIEPGATARLKALTIADGYGWDLAGGILNNGNLTLDQVTLSNNTMATGAGDFWKGGGGIYNGEGAVLNLIDSTVSGNHAAWSGGGIYSFFNTSTTIIRSTVSGNLSNDVGGGIRSLGNMTIINSTISENTSTGWHGGAIFHTDGNMTITNSTIANNVGPDWAPSAIFIGSWNPQVVPALTLTNTIITGNRWYACEQNASGGMVSLVSSGHNLVQDGSCNPAGTDLITGDAMIGALALNGGPTLTHALLPGSPAIDAADHLACPAIDQRGVTRPQGLGCDIGSFELTSP
jgi:beta-glucanase (GH16 family)